MAKKNRYSAIGRRLKIWIRNHWRTTPENFCAEMGINIEHLELYLNGTRDPLAHATQLARLGVDCHYLLTGEYLIGMEELAARELLIDHGLDSYDKIYTALHADEVEEPDEQLGRAERVHRMYSLSLNEYITALTVIGYCMSFHVHL